jgi:hypothetical protein
LKRYEGEKENEKTKKKKTFTKRMV